MKTVFSILAPFCLLTLQLFILGCAEQGPKGDLSQTVRTLEGQVDSLEKRVADQSLKTRIVGSHFGRSPLDDFFSSPEFWEKVYDNRQTECAKRCIREIQQHRAQCAQLGTEIERGRCYTEAADRGSQCQQQCSR
jgi:hypothetical protein